MRTLTCWFLLPLMAVSSSSTCAAASAQEEIAVLLESLAASECRFYRNGSWYAGARASSHLQRKFDYLQDKDRISDAESFIVLAATQSSRSGEAYQVHCPGQPTEPSAAWMHRTLEQIRAGARP
jgi:hypothetical protein